MRSRSGDTSLADMYPPWTMCETNITLLSAISVISWCQYFGNGKSYNKFVVILQTGIFKGIQWKNMQSCRPYLVHIMRLYQFYTGLLCVGCVSYILYSCSMFFVTWERWPEINQKVSRIKVDFIGNFDFIFYHYFCHQDVVNNFLTHSYYIL